MADGSAGGAHSLLYAGALKCGTGRGGGAHQASVTGQHDFAVGADVDQQLRFIVAIKAGSQYGSNGISAYKTADLGEYKYSGVSIAVEVQL